MSFQATRLGVVMVSSQSNVAAQSAPLLMLYKISVLLGYVKLWGLGGGESRGVRVVAFGHLLPFNAVTPLRPIQPPKFCQP